MRIAFGQGRQRIGVYDSGPVPRKIRWHDLMRAKALPRRHLELAPGDDRSPMQFVQQTAARALTTGRSLPTYRDKLKSYAMGLIAQHQGQYDDPTYQQEVLRLRRLAKGIAAMPPRQRNNMQRAILKSVRILRRVFGNEMGQAPQPPCRDPWE